MIRFLASVPLTLFLLVGCVPLPIAGWVPVGGAGLKTLDLPDYSRGPVSSEQFPDLVRKAIPPGEGTMHVFGSAELILREGNRGVIVSAVASLSDTAILVLMWHEPDEQYEMVARVPYSDILSVSTNSWGLGRTIYLCLATSQLVLGDETHEIDQQASLSFIKDSGVFQDVEKSETGLLLLQEKITPIDGACDEPDEPINDTL
jgi:hypothetical protein